MSDMQNSEQTMLFFHVKDLPLMEHFYIANIESPCREYLDVGLGLPYNQSNIYTKLFVMFDTTFFQPQLRAT